MMAPDFSGVANLAVVGIIAIFGTIIIGIYSIVDYLWLEDTYKTNKRVIPEVIIKTETHNRKSVSDTTYIYKFN